MFRWQTLCFLWGSIFLCLSISYRVSAGHMSNEPDFWVLTALEPPFSLRNERGQLEGYLIELVQGILAEADIQQEILAGPWERLIQEAQDKPNVLVFPLARTPEREKEFHWVLPLTSNVYGVLGVPVDDTPIRSFADVNAVVPIMSMRLCHTMTMTRPYLIYGLVSLAQCFFPTQDCVIFALNRVQIARTLNCFINTIR